MNCTVFTRREDYSRPRNLQLVCDALQEGWGTDLHVNNRDDIICNKKWKVSTLHIVGIRVNTFNTYSFLDISVIILLHGKKFWQLRNHQIYSPPNYPCRGGWSRFSRNAHLIIVHHMQCIVFADSAG